jgi:transposase
MAYKLDPMDLKQILSLHLDGYSNRQLAKTLNIGRNTVNSYFKLFKACDVPITELITKSAEELRELFPSHSTIDNTRFEALMSYFEKVNLARSKPGFTFQYHYQEYLTSVSEPYSYTQFMEHYHRKHSKKRGSMKLEHVAGNELFIDYAGKKLEIVDALTAEVTAVEIFVATLPCSQYTYVEACLSQKKGDLIKCTANALRFFGGVPKAIVCDNLKSAVTRSSKYEAEINRSFKDFARHYNCVINPTRAYAPQDKALVENAVQLTYQRIYYPIREMTFFSLAELNKEIWHHLEHYNDLLFSRKEASRKELFQSIEREFLKPLPVEKYEVIGYKRAKVQKIGYVYFSVDKTYYSVPYRYIGKHTQLQFTQSKVEVYYNHQRIAGHTRNPSKGTYTTNKDHLSSSHKAYSEWSPSYFINLAIKHGSSVEALVTGLINQGDYPEVQYKKAMGVIQLHQQYGSERLNTACHIALQANTYSYIRIKNILQNNMDKLGLADELITKNQSSHIPKHHNIRGAKAYQ